MILSILWLLAPPGIANFVPVLAKKVPLLDPLDVPVDMGKSIRGRRIFGDHKTVRGFVSAFVVVVFLVWGQQLIYSSSTWIQDLSYFDYTEQNVFVLSLLFTLGALGGDAIKSFFKRQFDHKPGSSWLPFDQIDFILGTYIALTPIVVLSPTEYIAGLCLFFALHILLAYIAYILKLKDTPI